VTIYDKHDKEIAVETTPGIVALDRGGAYSKAWYRLDFALPGYYPYETTVNPQLDGWYWGNIVWFPAFGLVGVAIAYGVVDPATGDMWTLTPRDVNCNFIPTSLNLTPEQVKEAELKANPVATNNVVPANVQKGGHK
jgi:hypothetical protein